ncbi:MAG TPA: ABC transporter permease [Vicinamibacterales bacterium]|nr:ABC transporter permease [Vicinamibacterales bacterium]
MPGTPLLTRCRLWLRSLLFRRRLEREMQQEMTAHLTRATERLLAGGMRAEDAKRAARLEFGPLGAIQEDARDARGARGIESIVADLRFGFRHFRRKPLSTLTMIVVLALGIGFNTALFLLVYSFVNGPLPGMARDSSAVRIRGIDRHTWPGHVIGREFSYPEYLEYAAQENLFTAVAAWSSADVVLDVGRTEESLHSGAATYVTPNYFQVLGVRPIMGAGLPTAVPAGDTATALAAVISHVVWERYFDRAPDVLGRTLKVNDVPVTIVGVAPRRFAGARTGGSQVRVWLPLNARPVVQRVAATTLTGYDAASFGLVARLRPGIQVSETLPTVEAIAARAAEQSTRGLGRHDLSTDVVELLASNYFPPSGEAPDGVGRVASLSIPVFILLITCTNVTTLLAGLAVARRREMALRLALGAPRRRIIRQLVTESVQLALAAGALGLFVIWLLLRLFDTSIPDVEIQLDWRGLVFTFGIAVATGIVFGLSPALHATRLALSEVLKDTTGAVVALRSRLQAGLVVAQIAFTQPALLGMGALILEMRADLRRLPSQVFADRILDVRFNTNPRYGSIDQNREEGLRRLQTRFAAVPGVVAVVPQENGEDYLELAVHPSDRVTGVESGPAVMIRAHAAPTGYFPLMGLPVVRGRDFNAADKADNSGVVISAGLARRLWGPADPIGRRVISSGRSQRNAGMFVVVGVVDDSPAGQVDGSGDVQRVFVPNVRVTGHFLIRTQGPAEPVLPAIRSAANAEAPDLPLVSATTLAAIEASERSSIVNVITAIGSSGALALFLSSIGLYAVVAFAVGQRVREIGIRTALGADRRRVVWMFLFRGLRLSLVGLFLGLTISVIVVRLMAVSRGQDPPAGTVGLAAVVACVVIGVAMLATWIPARRAAHIDPLQALRSE